MKKTLAVLFVAAGIAAAAQQGDSVTLSSYFTDNSGDKQATVDSVIGLTKQEATDLSDSFTADFYSNVSQNMKFTINTADLLVSSELPQNAAVTATCITLSSASGNQWYIGDTRHLEISVNGQTFTTDSQVATGVDGSHYGTLAFSLSGDNQFTFNVGDILEITFPATLNVAHNAYGVFKGQTGVSNILAPGGQSAWQPSVKIDGILATPEPATATLSLLALAGLAARRRRH